MSGSRVYGPADRPVFDRAPVRPVTRKYVVKRGVNYYPAKQVTANNVDDAYQLEQGDQWKLMLFGSIFGDVSPVTVVRIPNDASVPFAPGTEIDLQQMSGTALFQVDIGFDEVNLLVRQGFLTRPRVLYSRVKLRKIATNAWTIEGDLARVPP